MSSALDDPVWNALGGRHAELSARRGLAARYPEDVAPFAALAEPSPAALRDLASLCRPGEFVAIFGAEELEPEGLADWIVGEPLRIVQMVCERALDPPDEVAPPLGERDVDAMLALVEATQPGPFRRRTISMGRYLGWREDGRLIAMGGERMKPDGYVELSGICTAPGFRGRGLAEGVVRALAARVQSEGEVPFLHVLEDNEAAIALYRRLGFRSRRARSLTPLTRPDPPG